IKVVAFLGLVFAAEPLYAFHMLERGIRSRVTWNSFLIIMPQKLKEYLDKNRSFTRKTNRPITNPDERLHIDSLGLLRLVAFLESEFGIRVEDEELTLRKLEKLLPT